MKKKKMCVIFGLFLLSVFSLSQNSYSASEKYFLIKPLKASYRLTEGTYYDNNVGYADTGNHSSDWANKASATLNLLLPFMNDNNYTCSLGTTWYRFFTYQKYNHLDIFAKQNFDMTMNNCSLNFHHSFDISGEPNTFEIPFVSKSLMKRRSHTVGTIVQADLGKLKVGSGFDYTHYRTNKVYNVLDHDLYTTFIDNGIMLTPLMEGFVRYRFSRILRQSKSMNNSFGNDIYLGLRGDLTPYLSGTISAGYGLRSYSKSETAAGRDTYSGAVYSGTLTNRLFRRFSQSVAFSLEPSLGYNISDFVRSYLTTYTCTYELGKFLHFNGKAQYIYNKESAAKDILMHIEQSEIVVLGCGIRYMFTKYLDFGIDYEFTDKDSNIHGKDFRKQAVTFDLGFTY